MMCCMNRRSAPIGEDIAELLRSIGNQEREAERALASIRAKRDKLILGAVSDGASKYAIAELVGLDRSQVGRIVGRVAGRRDQA